MERLLLLWDELDDLTGACTHVIAATAEELASAAVPLAAAAISGFGGSLLAMHAPDLVGLLIAPALLS